MNDPNVQTLVTKTTTSPDALGRPLSQVDAANGSSAAQTTSYAYDYAGRQTGSTGQANTGSPQTTTTSYDNLDRVTSVVHPDQSSETTTYDADGQQLTHSNCGASAGAGITSYTYDNLGNAIQQVLKDCSGNPQSTEGDLYDVDGNLTQRATTPAGGSTTSFSFTYNQLDQPTSLNDATRQYILDALGNVTSMTVAPSSTAPTATSYQASYDTGNRLVSLTSYGGAIPPLHSYSYAYDQHNNRTSITADGTTTHYTYDAYNQLLSSQVGTATPTTYEYDANHNRLKMTTAAGTTQYTYDDSHTRLTSLTDPSNKVTTFSYDHGQPNEVGNLWQKVYDPTGANQVTTYGYDTNNRLNYVSLPDGTVVGFTFDADGNRTQKSVTPSGGSATVTNDTYQNGLLQYETNGSGTLLATFAYDGQGVPVSVRVGSDPNTSPLYYYVYNGHGDVDALVDSTGTVVASYTYDDWGAITASGENFAGANGWSNPYRYDGHDRVRYDAETGLYWMSVRAYDPTLGRFISHDPLGRLAAAGMDTEPYVYAGNDPLVHVDPSGTYRVWDGMTNADVKQSRREVASAMRTAGSGGCGGCKVATGSRISPNTGSSCGASVPDNICKAQRLGQGAALKYGLLAVGAQLVTAALGLLAAAIQLKIAGDLASVIGSLLAIPDEAVAFQIGLFAIMIEILTAQLGAIALMFTSEDYLLDGQWTHDGLERFRYEVFGLDAVFIAVFMAVYRWAGGIGIGAQLGALVGGLLGTLAAGDADWTIRQQEALV